jgi:hypothetical protein
MSAAPKGDIREAVGAKLNDSLWQSFAHSVRDPLAPKMVSRHEPLSRNHAGA